MAVVVKRYRVDEQKLYTTSLPEWRDKLGLIETPRAYQEVAELIVIEYLSGNSVFGIEYVEEV